ncbi:MAG: hypothetical protein AABW90_01305 [Nanoarchaeota archaeon]
MKILETLRNMKRGISEAEVHIVNELLDSTGHWLGFNYELKHWHHINEKFVSSYGASYFNQELHDIINKLVSKGYIVRNLDDPINIKYHKTFGF